MTLPGRALAVALLLVIGAFVGATIWSQRASHSIDDDALFISRDAAPGAAFVSNFRADMRDLQAQVARIVAGRPGDLKQIDLLKNRRDDSLAQALALPKDEHESDLFVELRASLRGFDEAVKRALDEVHAGHLQQARDTMEHDIRPLADEVSVAATELVQYDTKSAADAAVRIETARRRADLFAYELDALCAMLSIGAALLALRIIRQARRVEEEKRVLIERKAEELEQFAGRVAHDILSPLSAVSMAVAIVEKRQPQEAEALSRASSSLQRVRGIVDGLLEFARAGARPEAGARTEVRPIVEGLLEELQPIADRAAAKLDVADIPACAVECSPGVLLSLIGNLMRNAIKYLGDSKQREVSLHIRTRRGRVLFEVQDTGPGIPSHLTQRVFQPYVRGPNVAAPGIGLGLATVKRLVESHGGSVGLRPAPGGGCIFWFELNESFDGEVSLDQGSRFQSA
ncbi:MAG TPA: ATP-binding protein [Myxococcales bacterium]|jgi:signal transduction histidine kinase